MHSSHTVHLEYMHGPLVRAFEGDIAQEIDDQVSRQKIQGTRLKSRDSNTSRAVLLSSA